LKIKENKMEEQTPGASPRPGKTALIEVAGLRKQFENVTALDGIDFEVYPGELFGFLGPNGAGKTTTINILTGLARPDAGKIRIGGLDCSRNPKAAQHLMGIVPDESNLYPELTGFQNLDFCASLYGIPKPERQQRARELLEIFGLQEAAQRKFGGYSKGMKRKLTIAAGIIHRPQILFLDEPTTGIDVASARQIRQLVADLHRAGTTIFLTTHYIEEAERLCKRIAFIVKGRIVQVDTVSDLLQPLQERKALLITLSNTVNGLTDRLAAAFPDFEFREISTEQVRVESAETISIGPLVRLIEDLGAEVIEAHRVKPSLEEIFVRITGIELEAMKKEKGANNR
jgi:ABC-2 type transport system ATP-binding protein